MKHFFFGGGGKVEFKNCMKLLKQQFQGKTNTYVCQPCFNLQAVFGLSFYLSVSLGEDFVMTRQKLGMKQSSILSAPYTCGLYISWLGQTVLKSIFIFKQDRYGPVSRLL
jgi:hypothetical protein